MADQLAQFKQDLDDLKQKRSHILIKLEESVTRAKSLKETLAKMGYSSLTEAKEAYASMSSAAEEKHEKVKQLINDIKEVESRVPSKDELLKQVRESILASKKEAPQSEVNQETKDPPEEEVEEVVDSKEEIVASEATQESEDTSNKVSDTNSIDDFELNSLLFGGL